MKKQIQALACAAMLAVGGFNVYTAMGGNDADEEIEMEDVEAAAFDWPESFFDWPNHNTPTEGHWVVEQTYTIVEYGRVVYKKIDYICISENQIPWAYECKIGEKKQTKTDYK